MAPLGTLPPTRGPLPDEVLPSLIRFAELLTPEIFRDQVDGDDEPLFPLRSSAETPPSSEPLPSSKPSIVSEVELAKPAPAMAPPSLVASLRRMAEPIAPAPTPPLAATALFAAAERPLPQHGSRWRHARAIAAVAAVVLVGIAGAGQLALRSVPREASAPHPAGAALPPEANYPASAPNPPPVDQLHWWTLREAFDRIGFDLDSVAAGSAPVPRVTLVMLPGDLDGIGDLDARKDLFLRAFLPVVLTVNERIVEDRRRLIALRDKIAAGETLLGGEVQWLLALADIYDQPDMDFDALLKKVDAIPPSLALAQAIEESGWGTSRIAKDQNAMFGQFGEDPLGAWDYRSFPSLTAAVESYARNLNTHRAYREFRQARATMRSHGGSMDAWALAATLFRYSERGPLYVKNLRWIIRDNDLRAFDSAHLNAGDRVAVIASNDDARDFDLPRP